MLLEIHMLQNHAPSNLNRDDTGSPKVCIFGGKRRARISSQCLKRSIRDSSTFKERMDGIAMGLRTRKLPEMVKDALIKDGISKPIAEAAGKVISGLGTSSGKSQSTLDTAQIMFYSPDDVTMVVNAMKNAIKGKDEKAIEKIAVKDIIKEFKKDLTPITPDIALFGRMFANNEFRDIEASMQVAHAISTNEIEQEFDFFTAVDDLKDARKDNEDKGAGMMGDLEYNSACYYKYFSLDLDGFLSNLGNVDNGGKITEDVKQVATKAVLAFIDAAITTTPSGKQNSFAAHQLPDGILIEIRPKKAPVSYANAFISPSKPVGGKDLMDVTLESFKEHVEMLTTKFSLESSVRFWFTTKERIKIDGTTDCKTVKVLLDAIEKHLKGGSK